MLFLSPESRFCHGMKETHGAWWFVVPNMVAGHKGGVDHNQGWKERSSLGLECESPSKSIQLHLHWTKHLCLTYHHQMTKNVEVSEAYSSFHYSCRYHRRGISHEDLDVSKPWLSFWYRFEKKISLTPLQIVLDSPVSVGSVSRGGHLTVAPFVSDNSFLRSERDYPLKIDAIFLHGSDFIRQGIISSLC